MLGLIAWFSVCLLAAGLSSQGIHPALEMMCVFAGLTGLMSAVGLAEVLKSEARDHQQQFIALLAEARTDILTGLANRRSFHDELRRRWAQWKRQGALLSLLFIDVDRFKGLNDSLGHQAGDELLKGIARALESTTREMDLLARYGGDEFAVLLPGTDLSNAQIAAERLRKTLADRVFTFGESEFQVTVTVGIAQVLPADEHSESLIRRADTGLYAAKEAGRNCCYVHNGLTSEPVDTVLIESVDTSPDPCLNG
jgi:diguanylate cyclase